MVFEPLGIALITRPLHKGPIKIVGEPLPHTLSALEAALVPPAPPQKPGNGPQPGSNFGPGSANGQKTDAGNQKPDAGGQGSSSSNTNRNGLEPRPQQPAVRGGGR